MEDIIAGMLYQCCGKMILDVHLGSGFFFIPDTGNKKALDPGSGSATLWDTVGGTLEIVYRTEITFWKEQWVDV
jgi:hypothetical protein